MPLNRRALMVVALAVAGAGLWLCESRAPRESPGQVPTGPLAHAPLDAPAGPTAMPSAAHPTPPSPLPSAATLPPAKSDDDAQLDDTRRASNDNPALALELAREGRRRYPASSHDDERARILVRALAQQGRLSEARGEAETMVNRYPDSPWAREVEQQTGAHPRRAR